MLLKKRLNLFWLSNHTLKFHLMRKTIRLLQMKRSLTLKLRIWRMLKKQNRRLPIVSMKMVESPKFLRYLLILMHSINQKWASVVLKYNWRVKRGRDKIPIKLLKMKRWFTNNAVINFLIATEKLWFSMENPLQTLWMNMI